MKKVEREKNLDEYITQKILQNQAGLTLSERVITLNVNFPGLGLSTYKLYNYFRAWKIRFKVLAKKYCRRDDQIENYSRWFLKSQSQIYCSQNENRRVIFVDESTFTSATISTRAFAVKGQHCFHPYDQKDFRRVHLIAAVSAERGLEGWLTSKKPVNSEAFVQILDKICQPTSTFCLLGDNSTWHTSRFTQSHLRARNTFFIPNVPYSPECNPIEIVFRMVKNFFKKYRLQGATRGDEYDCERIIKKAMSTLNDDKIKNICSLGLLRWR